MSDEPVEEAGEGLSKVEGIKANSRHLRGTIAQELEEETPAFSDENVQLLKFHGIYQQDDRDKRKEARKLGLDKHHQMMIRTRIPGGVVGADGYLTHDDIAGEWGNGTLRVTTRQDFQLHGVLKGDMRRAIRAINQTVLTTLGGCGDQERNIMCCPAPLSDSFRDGVHAVVPKLVAALTPETRAYHEIWIDGELAASSELEVEPLYGDTYLPRKFKTAVGMEGDNCVDAHAHDLALVGFRDERGGLGGFTILVGGGMGRHRNKPETFAAVAQPLVSVTPERAVATAVAVVCVQRDHGDRSNRRHARLKYLIADRGLEWFRGKVQEQVDFPLGDPRPVSWPPLEDHLGWHEGDNGSLWLGIFVENGRIADDGDSRMRTGLRRVVEELRPDVRLTPQQNVILTGIEASQRRRIDELLEEHGIVPVEKLANSVRHSMACPAWPTCGLATAEAERLLPALIRRIDAMVSEVGLQDERITYRMTGCPNGCARPYQGDVGFVGTTIGKYDVFLGGDPEGRRLNTLYAAAVPADELVALLRGPMTAFRDERQDGDAFGDWCHQVGVSALRARFDVAEPAATLASHPGGISTPLPVLAGA